MTVEFDLDGDQFVALNGGPEFTFSEAVSFQIDCADQDEVDRYWSTLSEGGEEGPMRMGEGQVRVVLAGDPGRAQRASDPDPAKAQAVLAAMLGMKKLVVSELQAAYDSA